MTIERLAFDRASVRTYDADGMLHVSRTPISKANVCVYYGREVPGWEELGLSPDKPYKFLRDPEELKRAASTFNNKPLLDLHEAVSIINPPKEMIVGATGHPFSIEFPVDRMSWATIAATIRAATARRSRDQMRAFTSAP